MLLNEHAKASIYVLVLVIGLSLGLIFGAAFIRYIYPQCIRPVFDTYITKHDSRESGEEPIQKAYDTQQHGHSEKLSLTLGRRNAIVQATEENEQCVVGIVVTKLERVGGDYLRGESFFDLFFSPHMMPRYRRVKSIGSGIIVRKDGLILTNYHVIKSARRLYVSLADGRQREGKVIGSDPLTDLALIDIPGDEYQTAKMGDSDDIYMGEWVIAIGNPFGFFSNDAKPSVTVGVVSATGRDFSKNKESYYQDMIQTDAAINPGNSGGPLVNAKGELIGINTFIYSGDEAREGAVGIGFAIPVNHAKRVILELEKYGERRPVWTGISVRELDNATSLRLGYGKTDGVVITSVADNSPAERAGLTGNDIIIKLGKRSIYSSKDLEGIFVNYFVGDTIPVLYIREGHKRKSRLVLSRYKG